MIALRTGLLTGARDKLNVQSRQVISVRSVQQAVRQCRRMNTHKLLIFRRKFYSYILPLARLPVEFVQIFMEWKERSL